MSVCVCRTPSEEDLCHLSALNPTRYCTSLEARGGERKLAGPGRLLLLLLLLLGAGWSAAAAAAALGLLLLLLLRLCGLLQLLGGRLQMLGVLQLLGGPAHRAQGGVEPRGGGSIRLI